MGVPSADLSAIIVELVPLLIFIALVIFIYCFNSYFLIFSSASGATCMTCYNQMRAGPSSKLPEYTSEPKVFIDMLIMNLKL